MLVRFFPISPWCTKFCHSHALYRLSFRGNSLFLDEKWDKTKYCLENVFWICWGCLPWLSKITSLSSHQPSLISCLDWVNAEFQSTLSRRGNMRVFSWNIMLTYAGSTRKWFLYCFPSQRGNNLIEHRITCYRLYKWWMAFSTVFSVATKVQLTVFVFSVDTQLCSVQLAAAILKLWSCCWVMAPPSTTRTKW